MGFYFSSFTECMHCALHKKKVTFFDPLLQHLKTVKNLSEAQVFPVINFPTIDKTPGWVLETLFFP